MIWNQESLQAMLEGELCLQVLVPLFEAMGYQDVIYHHGGALEQGKDFVMWREEPIKGRVNYAVVVKAKKLSGAASQGMHEVLMQIKQSLGSSYIDKRTLEQQPIHQCFFVTSHEIKKEGTNSFRNILVHEKLIGRVFPIDGPELWKLTKQHLSQHTVHSQLESAFKALGSPHPDYDLAILLKPGEQHFGLVPKSPDAEPISVPLTPNFPDTPQGHRKKEEFETFVRTGSRVELDHETLRFEDLPEIIRLMFPFAEGNPYTVVLGPSQINTPIPMLLTAECANGLVFNLPGLEFTEAQGGVDAITFSNQRQPIPLKVRLTLSEQDKRVGINYNFQLAGQGVYWLVQATRFYQALADGARLVLRDLRSGVELFPFRILPGRVKGWGQSFSRIAQGILEIQDLVKVPVLIPQRSYFTDQDVEQMILIRGVLDTGSFPSCVESFTATFINSADAAKSLLAEFGKVPGPELFFKKQEHFELLLDQQIPLGPMEARIREARLLPDDLPKLRACALGKSRRKEIDLRLIAGEGQSIEVKFPKWPRKDADPPAALREDSTPAPSGKRKGRAKGK